MNYRKKPVVIQALQLLPTQESILQIINFMGDTTDLSSSQVAEDRFSDYCNDLIKENKGLRLKTLESDNETQIASFGDYIIKGVKGEFYPVKPEIFKETYEAVE